MSLDAFVGGAGFGILTAIGLACLRRSTRARGGKGGGWRRRSANDGRPPSGQPSDGARPPSGQPSHGARIEAARAHDTDVVDVRTREASGRAGLGTVAALDLTSVTTEREFIAVCGPPVGITEGSVFDLAFAYEAAPQPLVVTVIGFERFSAAMPTLARYVQLTLRQIEERHRDEGTEIRFH